MPDIITRNVDEGVVNALTQEAERKGISREALIKQILDQYVKRIGIPPKGFLGYASNGTEFSLFSVGDEIISSTTKGSGLTEMQVRALRKAELICQPKNGSRWAEARKLLESVNLEVYER